MVRQNASASLRSFIRRVRTWASGEKLESTPEGLTPSKVLQRVTSPNEEPVVQGWRINNQVLILSCPSAVGLSAAVSRVTNDYYFSNMAVFREGDTLVDIGAHVGVMSIYLAKTYPFLKVYAIEPDPFNYACLIRNLELNGVTNVTAINTAVTGDEGKKTLYVDVPDSSWATTDASLACSRGSLRVEEVASVTLEALFDKCEIRHCRLLKITAPGSVLDILKQFKGRRSVDLLCGEADINEGSRAKLEMVSWSIARQHFLRIRSKQVDAHAVPWILQLPTGCEEPRAESKRQPVPLRTHVAPEASQSLEREAG
jgi:FkbM family methyltransferase